MRAHRKLLSGFLAIAIAIACGMQPVAEAKPTVVAPHGSVTIKRDNYGTPHIYADSVYGLFFGYGYAVAQDRLFQMEMARRTFTGQVAEVLGEKYVKFDESVRANFKPESLASQYTALAATDRAVFEGYATGFNAWIKQVEKNPDKLMPKQFNDMDFKPVAWTAMDVVMIFVGSMANRFSDSNTEIDNLGLLNALKAKHGEQVGGMIFDQLKWLDDPNAPTTIPTGAAERKVVGPELAVPSDHRQQTAALVAPSSKSMLALSRLPRDPYGALLPMPNADAQAYLSGLLARDGSSGMAGFAQASNMWIVGKDKAQDAQAILLNGPQFGWFNPAYVYSVGLHGAGFNVVGNTPFAYPNILFGHNGKIAWGSTAAHGDGVDIYQEQLSPDNQYAYLYNGKYLPMSKRTDLIKVKDAPSRTLDVYGTVHGLVAAFDQEKGVAYSKKRSWDGHELESMLGWLHQARAQNYDQWLQQAARMAISINWYYADVKGNIGYAYTGKYPKRKANHDPRLPAIGSGVMEWEEILPFSSNPQMLNPQQGWIANWNNKPAPGYPNPDMFWLSWAETDRVSFLIDQLKAGDKFDTAMMRKINQKASYVDVNARYFIPYLQQAVASLPATDPRRQAVALFDGWDQQAGDDDGDGKYDHPAATVMRIWLQSMLKRTLADVIPENYLKFYASAGYPLAGVPLAGSVNIQPGTKVLYQALKGMQAGIPQKYDFFNGKDPLEVVRAALSDSVVQAKKLYGDDMQQWRTPVAEQIFLANNFLGIPQANSNEVLQTPIAMNRGSENNIISFSKNRGQSCEVTPPGQSGFIAPDGSKSRHYQDQLDMYAKFECKPTWLDAADVDRHLESTTVLKY